MKKKRSNILDIIKGLMIIFIIITHFRFVYPDDYKRYGFFFWIDMAVPVFMIITGYVTSIQYRKRGIESLDQAYSIDVVIPKVLRFLVPFLIIMLLELPYMILVNEISIIEIIVNTVRGGIGPGAYYTPIMIQLVFLVPLIYILIKKYDWFGVILCFVLTALWEMIQYCWGMDSQSYKIIAFRYISVIAFGCFIAIGKKKLNIRILGLMFFVGIIWQIALNYMPLYPVFMNFDWARVNYLSSLFIMPVLYVLIKKFYASEVSIFPLQEIGKASFNIFLVQMVFYGCGLAGVVYMIIDNIWIQLVLCIGVCLFGGYIFYKIEHKLTSFLIKRIRQKNYYEDYIIKIANVYNDSEK